MTDEADRFRKQAEEAREQPAKAISLLDKEAWLRIAEEWLKLALSVESRRAPGVRPPQLAAPSFGGNTDIAFQGRQDRFDLSGPPRKRPRHVPELAPRHETFLGIEVLAYFDPQWPNLSLAGA
jgi:hypothetical protein